MHVYLVGFMGAGKTTVGSRLAEISSLPFLDLDHEVEVEAGATIREIFATEGESGFRAREATVLERLADGPDAVVATGGGTLTNGASRAILADSGVSVWLNPPFASIIERIGSVGKLDRPLFENEAQALVLYRERLPLYQRANLTVDVTPSETAIEVAQRIQLRLRERYGPRRA